MGEQNDHMLHSGSIIKCSNFRLSQPNWWILWFVVGLVQPTGSLEKPVIEDEDDEDDDDEDDDKDEDDVEGKCTDNTEFGFMNYGAHSTWNLEFGAPLLGWFAWEVTNSRGDVLQCSHYMPIVRPEGKALPCVFYCHGNSGCRADASEAAIILLPSHITVFTLDFSGDVGNNHLVGTIRELIRIEGCFPSLRNLYLNNNYLTGGIPAQLANLTNLEILYLDHNQFTGRIPDAFYKHTFLKEMYIEGNAFRPGVNPIGIHNVLEVSDTEFLF
ncbi:hypothetical protein TEA_013945 [Camellia sinensis var. sinensis]|uniref:Leucine-rich repeat-containing N-terminal plant-type domain-containing protein n=1 Tax=Camellia sinensis var. sinensis TaxID=542762 RepID=A0A4S4ES60_CAMSN|nr:hypothetical protein TEA_013945 [Camellia sinensis var. sinensis]